MAEHKEGSAGKEHLAKFLHGLGEFKTPVETISELAKHEKVDNTGSWTEAEMESELLYWVQLYLTHLGCPLEYVIPCARAIVTEVFGGNFRMKDFEAPPPQVIDSGSGDAFPGYEANGHYNLENPLGSDGVHMGNGDGQALPVGPVLSAKSLYSFAVEKANEMLKIWKNDLPNFDPVRLPHQISVYATRNKRPGMEDRYVVIPDLRAAVDLKGIKEPVSFYAVYDGHAGVVAASYAAAHLHRLLCTSKHFPDHMSEALKEAFVATDDLYGVKGQRDHDYSGTTAVVSIVFEKKLYIAWVGDSEAAIVQSGNASKLVEPRHVASNEGERSRVESEGGSVIMNQGGWRVGAVLSVTRAIGDFSFKPFVTANPDVRVTELTGNEDYLVVACDGLWDELTPELAMKEANRFLLEHPDRPMDVAKALSEKARKSGSLDNITVLVVMLRPVEEIIENLRNAVPDAVADTSNSLPNSSGSQDDFADLAQPAEMMEVDFNTSGTNPFDTTPLDGNILGDFGTPDRGSMADTEWKFQRSPPEGSHGFETRVSEDEALNVLDQAIGAHSPVAQSNQDLLNFDMSTPQNSASRVDHQQDGEKSTNKPTTPPSQIFIPAQQHQPDVKVPDFVKVFDQQTGAGNDNMEDANRQSEDASKVPSSSEDIKPSAPPLPPNASTGDLLRLDDGPSPDQTVPAASSAEEKSTDQVTEHVAVSKPVFPTAQSDAVPKSAPEKSGSTSTSPKDAATKPSATGTAAKSTPKPGSGTPKPSPTARAASTPKTVAPTKTPSTPVAPKTPARPPGEKTESLRKPLSTPSTSSAPVKHRMPDTPRPAATPRSGAKPEAFEAKAAPKPPARATPRTPLSAPKTADAASEKPAEAQKKPTATPRLSQPATPRPAGATSSVPKKTPASARPAAKSAEKKAETPAKPGEEKPGESVGEASAPGGEKAAAEPVKKAPAAPRVPLTFPKTRSAPASTSKPAGEAAKPSASKTSEPRTATKTNEPKPAAPARTSEPGTAPSKASPTQLNKPAVPSRLVTGTSGMKKTTTTAATTSSPKPSARGTPKTPEGTSKPGATGTPTRNGVEPRKPKTPSTPGATKSSLVKKTPASNDRSAAVEQNPTKVNGETGHGDVQDQSQHQDQSADFSQMNGNAAPQENGEHQVSAEHNGPEDHQNENAVVRA